jgi:branched-chain amino acid transport system permease protein
VLFAVLGVLIVMLRRSGFGQRLIAMKDSPAASATLGQNPIRLKLGVFMLSCGIAGLGGALLSAALVTVDINSFTIFSSLGIVMSVVIAGIGYVSGAFTGGLLVGIAYVAIQNSLDKVGTDHGSLHGMFAWLATFTTVLPAIVGVGLGKNPSGFVSDIINGFRPLAKAKPMIALGIGIEIVLYVLADTKNISNWWFVVGTILMVLLWPAIARMLMPGAFKAEAAEAKSPLDVPLEMVGIDQPLTPEILAALDDELGIPAPTGEYSGVAATMVATTSAAPAAGTSSAGTSSAGTTAAGATAVNLAGD